MTSFRRTLALAVAGATSAASLLLGPAGSAGAAATHASYAPRSFTVENGHKVTITLQTASDGGYGWVITEGRNSPKFTVVSKKVVSAGKPGVVGGYTRTVYVLRTRQTGNATFKAIERRVFDKSDVINRFTLHLRITKG